MNCITENIGYSYLSFADELSVVMSMTVEFDKIGQDLQILNLCNGKLAHSFNCKRTSCSPG